MAWKSATEAVAASARNTAIPAAACLHLFSADRVDDLLGHLLRIAQQRHRIVPLKQIVVHPGIADAARRSLDKQQRFGFSDIDPEHAIDERVFVGFRRRIGDIVGADHESAIGLRAIGVDVFQFEQVA